MSKVVAMNVAFRPQYLQETLQSWRRVRGLSDTRFEFYIEPSPIQNVLHHLCQEFIDETTPASGFITIFPEKQGVLRAPYMALKEAFDKNEEDYIYLAEDDVIVSTDVLEYHEWAIERFRDDSTVFAVCNFSSGGYPGDVHNYYRHSWLAPSGWGTWRDRWERDIEPTWDMDYSSGRHDNSSSGWDWNINLRILQGRVCIFPHKSKSQHIGKEGGAHCTPEMFEGLQSTSFVAEVEPGTYTEL